MSEENQLYFGDNLDVLRRYVGDAWNRSHGVCQGQPATRGRGFLRPATGLAGALRKRRDEGAARAYQETEEACGFFYASLEATLVGSLRLRVLKG